MTRNTTGKRPLDWPDDPETVTAADVDFEALAHVLANTCRRGGCTRQYHSVAAHAVIVSEEVAALDGLGDEDRRRLALHALIANAPSAWLRGRFPDSQRAADRAGKLAARIETAIREAAGLDAVLDEEQAELLRFVTRMAAAAERRDIMEDAPAGGGALQCRFAPHAGADQGFSYLAAEPGGVGHDGVHVDVGGHAVEGAAERHQRAGVLRNLRVLRIVENSPRMGQFAPHLEERGELHRRGLADGAPEQRPLDLGVEAVAVLDDVGRELPAPGTREACRRQQIEMRPQSSQGRTMAGVLKAHFPCRRDQRHNAVYGIARDRENQY